MIHDAEQLTILMKVPTGGQRLQRAPASGGRLGVKQGVDEQRIEGGIRHVGRAERGSLERCTLAR